MEVTLDENSRATKIRMRKGADMHQHLRKGELLKLVAPMVSKRFAMAIVMPNTLPPITTRKATTDYANEIGKAVGNERFYPLMTLYLTDQLDPREVGSAGIVGIKYYPRGLTTNSNSGVEDPRSLWTKGTNPYEALRALAACQGVLLLHAADGFDKGGSELDPFEQEPHFIRETLPRIRDAHPDLKISVEHLSTMEGATYLEENGGEKLGCSLTAQHLLLDRRDLFRGGFRPERFWWPIIQSEEDRDALRGLAKKDLPFVWLGSDSAPHPSTKKRAECCAGGVLMAHAGIELYAEAFEGMGALDDRFERFASINGPRFYGLPPSEETIELAREAWTVEKPFACFTSAGSGVEEIIPFRLGEKILWKLATDNR